MCVHIHVIKHIHTHITLTYIHSFLTRGSPTKTRARSPLDLFIPAFIAELLLLQSYISKGIWRQGIGSFCKEFLCFNTMPCRHMPLIVHFWPSRPLRFCFRRRASALPRALRGSVGPSVLAIIIYIYICTHNDMYMYVYTCIHIHEYNYIWA